MKTKSGLIVMDRKIPFVDAIFHMLDGEAIMDTAVSLLNQAEKKHGIAILRDLPMRGIFRARDQNARFYPRELHRLAQMPAEFNKQFIQDEQYSTQELQLRMFAFISELESVIQGMDFAEEHCMLFDNHMLVSWSQRGWGSLMADWANHAQWMSKYRRKVLKREWEYVDFYLGINDKVIWQYDKWAQMVLKTIQTKCTRACA